jgi:uncharacterized protein with PIN domain
MSDSESGGWLSDAVESGRETIEAVTSTFLGVEREAHVCPDCNEPCQETYTYNPSVAAFHEGKSPAWACPECGTTFVREVDDTSHTLDLYGRDPPN